MKKPIRILQVMATLDRGGAETAIMNIYRAMDRSKFQFDFIVNDQFDPYHYEAEIKALGGKIYYVPKYQVINHKQFKKAWIRLLKYHPQWKIIHCHHTSCAFVYLPLIHRFHRTIIVHSHSSSEDKTLKGFCAHLLRLPLKYQADYLFACSKAASVRMFGNNHPRVYILNNAINIINYDFSEERRVEKRAELQVTDNFVIGHIGNFTMAKNYPFLLEVFYKIYEHNPKAVLLLIGKSDNDPSVSEKVKELHLENSVIFTGIREDIADLLQAMDVFLFPSLYEGIPLALIEAQASGLKCIVSDSVSEEVEVTDQIEFISLKEISQYWCDRILTYQNGYIRQSQNEKLSNAGYDIKEKAKWLEHFYWFVNKKIK